MRKRGITEDQIKAVLNSPGLTWYDPKQESMALSGSKTESGTLIVWVAGDHWPIAGMVIIKSTAWRR
jgi:hypothetical protein